MNCSCSGGGSDWKGERGSRKRKLNTSPTLMVVLLLLLTCVSGASSPINRSMTAMNVTNQKIIITHHYIYVWYYCYFNIWKWLSYITICQSMSVLKCSIHFHIITCGGTLLIDYYRLTAYYFATAIHTLINNIITSWSWSCNWDWLQQPQQKFTGYFSTHKYELLAMINQSINQYECPSVDYIWTMWNIFTMSHKHNAK